MMGRFHLALALAVAGCPIGSSAGFGSSDVRPLAQFRNQDGSATLAEPMRGGGYRVLVRNLNRAVKPMVLKPADPAQAAMFEVRLVDLDGDGRAEIETAQACGNRACQHDLYRLDAGRGRWSLLFSGEYGQASMQENHLVLGTGSGCCQHEIRLFRMPALGQPLAAVPDAQVIVSSRMEAGREQIRCTVLDQQFESVAAPSPLQLRQCAVLGPAYELVTDRSPR